MHIQWAALVTVAVAAAGAALSVVLLVAAAIVALSTQPGQPAHGTDHDHTTGIHPGAGTTTAVLCLLAAALIVCYGLYLIIT